MSSSPKKKNDGSKRLSERERYALRLADTYVEGDDWKRGPVQMAELLSKSVDPVYARRGFASTALVRIWPEIVGHQFADCTMPEKIRWNDGNHGGRSGILTIRVDGPKAVYLQHETMQILERLNRFFGFRAIQDINIIQGTVERREGKTDAQNTQLSKNQEAGLRTYLDGFENDKLQEAVISMGRNVLRKALAEKNKQ